MIYEPNGLNGLFGAPFESFDPRGLKGLGAAGAGGALGASASGFAGSDFLKGLGLEEPSDDAPLELEEFMGKKRLGLSAL